MEHEIRQCQAALSAAIQQGDQGKACLCRAELARLSASSSLEPIVPPRGRRRSKPGVNRNSNKES